MTSAPPKLLAARRLLLDHLDMNPGIVPADLDPAEVGIVGDAGHVGGYHCGVDRVKRDPSGNVVDYSVVESSRDRAGLDDDSSAMDVGYFKVTTPVGTVDLYDFNAWLVAGCQRGAPDTLDIREVIYSPDGVTVRRWDRLGKRTTGDSSHRTHTHMSEFRDANGRNMEALMRRWLIHIGLIEEDDMDKETFMQWWADAAHQKTIGRTGLSFATTWQTTNGNTSTLLGRLPDNLPAKLDEILAAAQDDGDATVILPPEAIAFFTELRDAVTALPDEAEVRDAVADLGEGGAAAVRADQDA